MKKIFTIAVFAFSAIYTNAAVWRVNNNGGITANYTTVQDAHDNAADGDTLLVEGSTISYGNLTMTKKLAIIGPGYFLGQNPETQVSFSPATIPTLYVNTGSTGSVFTGLTFTSDVNISESGVIFKRNYFMPGYGIDVAANKSNIVFNQNFFEINTASYQTMVINAGCSNIIFTNNFIANQHATGTAINMNATAAATFSNNVIKGNVVFNNAAVNNNILISGTLSGSNNSFQNNLSNSTQFPLVNGNQNNVDMNLTFVGGTGNSTDGQYNLAPGSLAIGAGIGGIDCGMFGGTDPYKLSGIPAIPAIYFLSAPSTGSASQGLPVQIKIKSHR